MLRLKRSPPGGILQGRKIDRAHPPPGLQVGPRLSIVLLTNIVFLIELKKYNA